MRIERIEIRDFRGFPGEYKFSLGQPGHNLLVYGENGSGKSSLFQALKRFFEADAKTDIRAQRNEFADAPEPNVKLEIAAYDAAGNRDPESGLFEWSDAAHPAAAALIQQANKTKGCLDYRTLLETHYVHRDKNHVEIFDLLMRTILPHVQNPVSGKPFGEELAAIRADKRTDMRGWKDSYLHRLSQFNQGLAATLETLITQANALLCQFFRDVELRLYLRGKLGLTGVGRSKALTFPMVFVAATFCKQQTRLDLHHFLNEARLSALAIALYLATLLITPPSRLRLLVLDDLLIGIDMSNRMAVLHILRDHFKDWQIILMTHDRVWFETVRMSTLDGKTWWYAELFAEPAHDGIPTPLWRGHEETWHDNLQRAKQHLLVNHDDRAAGVYARAAFEGKLRQYCNNKGVAVQYKSDPSKLTTELFWKAIKDKLTAENKLAQFQRQISDIETYRKVVLNPLSHEHPITLTQAEIQGAITAIEELEKVLK